MNKLQAAQGLCDFVSSCPSAYHTCATVSARLEEAGFAHLPEGAAWEVRPGGRYYTTRNNSSVVAFAVGEKVAPAAGAAPAQDAPYHFQMASAHADSPTLKLKSTPELAGPGGYLRLETEVYGGAIDRTWLDRPLGIAGRVMVREGSRVTSHLVNIPDVIVVPSVAIHLSHGDDPVPARQTDLVALFSAGELEPGAFDAMLAEAVGNGARPQDILGHDLYAVSHTEPRVWGYKQEFVSAGHLDDLQSAYAALEGFVAAENPGAVNVYACFDNEEVGSGTRQGALSTFLKDTLVRANAALGFTHEDYLRALSASIMLSCDNAHAVHPNRAEKTDAAVRCWLNGGLVIKENASQRYCTDAFGRAALRAVLDEAGAPYQVYANRSDIRGGQTLGNLSTSQVSVCTVDVGLPQLAMHSAYETTGSADTELGIRALTAFYAADLRIVGADSVSLG